jgi:hypothetical protein
MYMARTTTTVRPPWDLIEKACKHAAQNNDDPTREYIQNFLSKNYNYDCKPAINRGLHLGVLDGIYEQIGDSFYIKSSS